MERVKQLLWTLSLAVFIKVVPAIEMGSCVQDGGCPDYFVCDVTKDFLNGICVCEPTSFFYGKCLSAYEKANPPFNLDAFKPDPDLDARLKEISDRLQEAGQMSKLADEMAAFTMGPVTFKPIDFNHNSMHSWKSSKLRFVLIVLSVFVVFVVVGIIVSITICCRKLQNRKMASSDCQSVAILVAHIEAQDDIPENNGCRPGARNVIL